MVSSEPSSEPAVSSDLPERPPQLQMLRRQLRKVRALIGYGMAANLGSDEQVLRHDLSLDLPDEGTAARLSSLAAALERIADQAELAAVQAVCKHCLLPEPPLTP